ncbi:MAG TPA: cation:proton antiporter, partial [Gemmatimonadaceae bacterium]
MEHFATVVALVGIVIVVASLLSGALEKSGIPLVAVFLILGVALGPWGFGLVDIGFDSAALHVLAMLALALVLFSDAVTIDKDDLRTRRALLWRVLGPGTLVPALLMTVAARYLLDLAWPAAAILGAALASTDPVLLRSAIRSPALPATPRVALRIESGMNDVVLLPIVVLSILALRVTPAATAGGEAASIEIVHSVIGLFVLGPLIGALVGWLGIILLERIRSRFGVRRDYESLYALGLAFSAFALAESVGGSGFLAAFAAGLMVSWQDVELCDCFLEYGEATAEMLLLLTFVALGTSLIWTGLSVIGVRTILFAIVALVTRTIVLYPVLKGAAASAGDRRIIALFGPRGLSSLLLTLLPIFAGVPGAERLFTITCRVVLLSVVLHGSGMAIFLRHHPATAAVPAPVAATPVAAPRVVSPPLQPAPARRSLLPIADESTAEITADTSDKITLDEFRELKKRGEEVILIDARADRNYRRSDIQAAGSVRLNPEDPVRDATRLRLSQRAT